MSMRRGRLGWGQRLGLGVAAALVIAVTFALGVLAGRQWARPQALPPQATVGGEEGSRAEAGPGPGGAAATPGRSSAPAAGQERERPEKEKLTFYHTLTAPVGPVGGALAGADRKSAGPSVPAVRAPGPASAPAAPVPRPLATTAAGAPAPVVAARPGEEGRSGGRWAVQVGAFKNRDQAESVQRRLSESGYAVSVTPVAASDGLRYRVRLGGYGSRGEAEQVAARVRSGGGLSTFVTPL
jgi:cell division septation protein DedD